MSEKRAKAPEQTSRRPWDKPPPGAGPWPRMRVLTMAERRELVERALGMRGAENVREDT